MKDDFDYNEYDGLSLALKEEESERMLSYYKAFGWEEYERRDDKRYFDIIHIRLRRKHKIPSKDRLQLLQVKMEAAVNRFALVRKNKHSRTVILGLTLGALPLVAIALGVWLLVAGFGEGFIPLAVSAIALGAITPFFLVPFIKKSVDSENECFALKFKEMTAEIARILSTAKKLYGGSDGNERE